MSRLNRVDLDDGTEKKQANRRLAHHAYPRKIKAHWGKIFSIKRQEHFFAAPAQFLKKA